MSGSAKAGTIAERHACELRVLPEFAGARSSEARFRRIFFSLTKTYMDVRFCEGRNHRREARVRAAGSARVRRCALLRSALQENLFLLDKDLHGCRQIAASIRASVWVFSTRRISPLACATLRAAF